MDGLPTGWWTTRDVLAYLSARGMTLTRPDWNLYVTSGQAPQPRRRFGVVQVWLPADIRMWYETRRRMTLRDNPPRQ